jgi:hypothetical protein
MILLRPGAWLAGLAVLLSPVFFVIYRLAVFNTMPRDDYARFLLWVVGHAEGALPISPYCYRILSMLMAAPLYYVLPSLHLTNMPGDLSPAYLQATAALSALAFLAWIAGTMLIYAVAIAEGGLSRGDAMLAGVLMFVLCLYGQISAVDPLTIALIIAGIASVRRRWVFAAFVLASIVANEKVALVLAIWLGFRCLFVAADRRIFGVQCVVALAAFAAYVALVRFLPMEGNSYQTDPSSYMQTLTENLGAYATGRGLLLNVLPAMVLAAIGVLAYAPKRRPAAAGRLFHPVDLLVIPALLVVALVLTHLFQAGRIVMHAAPLFVIPAVVSLRAWLDATPLRPGQIRRHQR